MNWAELEKLIIQFTSEIPPPSPQRLFLSLRYYIASNRLNVYLPTEEVQDMSNSAARDAAEFLQAPMFGITASNLAAAVSESCIAPYLPGLSVDQVSKYLKLRERYDLDLPHYARLNNRNVNNVYTSWKHKVDLLLMEEWALMKYGKLWGDVTEDEFKIELYKIRDRTVHSRTDVPDVLKGKIKMDMKIEDPEQRVLRYFATIRSVITDNGLKDLIKPDLEENTKFCSIVIKYLSPAPLKEDIQEHMTYDEFKSCKKNRKKLYDLIVARAIKQQKRHNYSVKYPAKSDGKRKTSGATDNKEGDEKMKPFKKKKGNEKYDKKKSWDKKDPKPDSKDPRDKPAELAKLKVHMDGCIMCGDSGHKLGDHEPKLSKAQHSHLWDAYYKTKGIPNPYKSQKKFLRKLFGQAADEELDEDAAPKFTVKINGVLEKPAIVDTGARSLPAISRAWLKELLKLDPSVEVEALKKPITFEAAGGFELVAKETVKVKINVQTVSGSISSYRPVTCCVIEENEELFLITNNMLKTMGINVDQQVIDKASQLAVPREMVCTVTNDGDDVASPRLEEANGNQE